LYVFSNANLYRVESTPGQANPYAAYKLAGIPSGLIGPWAVTRDGNEPFLAWLGSDGIYAYGGSGRAENITKEDLLPLFPFEGRPGLPVVTPGGTLFPPDLTQQTFLRLAYADGLLYFDYVDVGQPLQQPEGPPLLIGNPKTLVYNPATKGWIPYFYAGSGVAVIGAVFHYQEQGSITTPLSAFYNSLFSVVGGYNGSLYYVSSNTTDDGTAFNCSAATPADDQSETRARKQYGDLMLDLGGVPTAPAAPELWQSSFVPPISAGQHVSVAVGLITAQITVGAFYFYFNDLSGAVTGNEVPPFTITWRITMPTLETHNVTIIVSNPVGPTQLLLDPLYRFQTGDHIDIAFISTTYSGSWTPAAEVGNYPGITRP